MLQTKKPPTNRQRKRTRKLIAKHPRGLTTTTTRTNRPTQAAAAVTSLTPREIGLLNEACADLLAAGLIDLRYMGIFYLELIFLRWTEVEIEGYPEAEFMTRRDREAWADQQFSGVWDWWSDLDPIERQQVVDLSREQGVADRKTGEV